LGWDGAAIQQADVASAAYSVYLLDDLDPDEQTVVTGHDGAALTVATVISDTYVTSDDAWTRDTTGYNFVHTIDVSSNAAFAVRGSEYLVEFVLTLNSGQAIRFAFRVLVE